MTSTDEKRVEADDLPTTLVSEHLQGDDRVSEDKLSEKDGDKQEGEKKNDEAKASFKHFLVMAHPCFCLLGLTSFSAYSTMPRR